MENKIRLIDEYRYPGFRPLTMVTHHPQDPGARIITLRRRQKKRYAGNAGPFIISFTIGKTASSETSPAVMRASTFKSRYAA
jgi:hypothetical protein